MDQTHGFLKDYMIKEDKKVFIMRRFEKKLVFIKNYKKL